MKKIFAVFLAILLIPAVAFGITYTFSPNPPNIDNLRGGNYYGWGIYQVFDDDYIVSATLTFSNIVNLYGNSELDVLHLNLLDNPGFLGVRQYVDSGDLSNAFAGQVGAVHLDSVYGIPVAPPPITYIYNFTGEQIYHLFNFTRDGYFGIGIDPQCHFYNDGITLTINTSSVPEPTTLLLLGSGLLGVGILGRKKYRKS